jgi:hypothetical protein
VLAHVILAQFPQYYTVSGRSEHLFFIAVSGSARDVRKKLDLFRKAQVDMAGVCDRILASPARGSSESTIPHQPSKPNSFTTVASSLPFGLADSVEEEQIAGFPAHSAAAY